MPNLASILKSEIIRVARKEIRAEIEGLKKSANTYRTEIAALKRRTQALEQALRQFQKTSPKSAPVKAEESGKALRFSAKTLASQRKRLGLSAEACGVLLGASGQSVYNWEAGETQPRDKHLAAIAALRTLSKPQAGEIVATRQVSK